MKVTIFDRDKFTKMGMGALAGVAAGTDVPPKFIIMEYWGGPKKQKPKIGGVSLRFQNLLMKIILMIKKS